MTPSKRESFRPVTATTHKRHNPINSADVRYLHRDDAATQSDYKGYVEDIAAYGITQSKSIASLACSDETGGKFWQAGTTCQDG